MWQTYDKKALSFAKESAVQEAAESEVLMDEKEIKIYNKIVEVLESDYTMYFTLGQARQWVRGYLQALVDTGYITANQELNIYFELDETLDEIREK